MTSRSKKSIQSEIDRLNKKLPDFCTADADTRGNIRVYFRRSLGSPKLRLRSEPFSPEFYIELADAKRWNLDSVAWRRRQKGFAPRPKAIAPTAAYTLGWLVDRYRQSDAFRSLNNKRPRELVLVSMLNEPVDAADPTSPLIRDMPLSAFDDRAVRALRDRKLSWETIPDPDDPDEVVQVRRNAEAANARVKALRSVLEFGFENHRDFVTDRWAHKVKLYPGSVEGFHCWTQAEIDQFRKAYEVGTRERLAFELLFWTGQRRGDIVRLGRLLLRNGMWEFRQEKNSKTAKASTAYVPVFPELQAVLDASRDAGILGDNIYLVSAYGTPFTKESFGNWFRDVCDKAGLSQCSAHGLRKAFVVNMIHKRMRPQQIMSITGHRTQKEFDRYSREFLRKEAALQLYEELCREYRFASEA